MSTEFNPAEIEDHGEHFKAVDAPDPDSCHGCVYISDDMETAFGCNKCSRDERPDKKDIIWVRAQEGKKA